MKFDKGDELFSGEHLTHTDRAGSMYEVVCRCGWQRLCNFESDARKLADKHERRWSWFGF